MTDPVRTLFFGSPAMAIPSLRALADDPRVEVVAVVTQPDLPAGRRRVLTPCPVRTAAEALGLPVLTPPKVRAPEALEQLRALAPALAIVCAYGQIFPAALLELPPLGCFNLHFSLLPRWRGASPVQAAILAGDTHTGVTLQRMAPELDAGDIAAATPPRPIAPTDTAATLGAALADEAAALLRDALPALISGTPTLTPQQPEQVTFCRIIKKSAGAVDFHTESALEVERKIRAYDPWPGCHGFLLGRRLVLVAAEVAPGGAGDGGADGVGADEDGAEAPPGVVRPGGLVATREGLLRLLRVKPEGKGEMDWNAFQNGNPRAVGSVILPAPV